MSKPTVRPWAGARALVPMLSILCAGGCVGAAGDDAPPDTDRAAGEVRASNTVVVPVAFHFFYSRETARGRAYLDADGREVTIRDYDAKIAAFNAVASMPYFGSLGGRAIRLVRASVRYVPYAGTSAPPSSAVGPWEVFGAINVVAAPIARSEVSAASGAEMAMIHPSAFLHEIGHTLGLHHVFRRSRNGQADDPVDAAWMEYLERDRNPASPRSCYRRGDATCDTVPDYGGAFVNADGTFDRATYNQCATLLPGTNLCDQGRGPACDAADTLVDAVARTDGAGNLCAMGATYGARHYDPVALGNVINRPGNVMAYGQQSWLTYEQVTRMIDNALWRTGRGAAVPAAEQSWVRDLLFAPQTDGLWRVTPDRTHALPNAAETAHAVWQGTWALSASTLDFTVNVPKGDERRVLAARLVLETRAGRLPSTFRALVTSPNGQSMVLGVNDVPRPGSLTLTSEDPATALANTLPGARPQGTWHVSIGGGSLAAGEVLTAVRLVLVTGDRAPAANDRDGRGLGDILVRRGARLWTSSNTGSATPTFGAGTTLATQKDFGATQVAVGGDFDGDGRTDVALFDRATPSARGVFAFGRDGYAVWSSPTAGPSYAQLYGSGGEALAGDLTGDGFADLVVRVPTAGAQSRWDVYPGRGDGNFAPASALTIGSSTLTPTPWARPLWTLGDFNGDGAADLMLRAAGTGTFSLAFSGQRTRFDDPVVLRPFVTASVGGGASAYLDNDALMAFDVNGDGLDDIVARRKGSGLWFTSLNQRAATFGAGLATSVGGGSSAYLDTDSYLNSVF